MKRFMLRIMLITALWCSMPTFTLAAPKNDWHSPLEIDAGLSSSFGEFRGNRVHTGIDFRTNGQTGYKVYAIDDGVIVRLSVRKLGFGNAVYIQHPNGLMSVYGHLERFEEQQLGLQSVVRQYQQTRKTKYPRDIYLEKPVKKGQIIGYSGESGYGLPHLHLEVRQGGATPIDPFEHGFTYKDTKPPVIESLVIEPLDSQSFLDSKHFLREYRTAKQKQNYVIRDVPTISGKVRFTLSAYDQIGAENRCAVEQVDLYIAYNAVDEVEMTIDGNKFFSNQFDLVTYSTNHRGGLVYDYNFSRLSNPTQYYYRLYNLSPAHFPYRKVFAKHNGIWDTSQAQAGLHTIIVEVRDVGGNISQAQMQVNVTKQPETSIQAGKASAPPTSSTLTLYDFQTFLEVVFQSPTPLAKAPTLIIAREKSPGKQAYSLEMKAKDAATFTATYDLVPGKDDGLLTVTVRGETQAGEVLEKSQGFPVNTIFAKSGGTVRYDQASMTFPPGALYGDIFANIFPTTAYDETPGLPLIGEVYDFRPAGCPLEKMGAVSLHYPETVKQPRKLGVYWWDTIKKRWYFMDDKLNAKARTVTAEIIYPSIYAVLQDNLNPEISKLVPADGGMVSANQTELSAIISDIGKGIDEYSIKMKLDGKTVDGEYDPDRDKYTYPLTKKLTLGKHTLTVEATDKAGNPAKSQSSTFIVK